MQVRRWQRIVIGAMCGLFVGAGQTRAACVVTQRTVVPATIEAGVPVVNLQVNGIDLPFVLDTGAQRSLITDAGVQRANVRLDEWASTMVKGISGYERHRNADPTSLELGGIPLHRRTVAADQTMTVGPLPQAVFAGHDIVGLLGADFLAHFDLDVNLPDRQATLYGVTGCSAAALAHSVPWPAGFDTIAASQPIRDIMIIPVQIDGRTLHAQIDSGSAISVLTASGIDRMGLSGAALAQDQPGAMNGVGRFTVATRRHRFATLRIGAERIDAPAITTAPVYVLPIVDMLLGEDWLRDRHVWLSYAASVVFVAPRR